MIRPWICVIKRDGNLSWKATISLFFVGILFGIFIGVSLTPKTQPANQIPNPEEPAIDGVYFSPRGGCENQVINWINKANSSIHVLIYSFTLDSVGNALIEALDRHIEVKIVFEKGQIGQSSEYQRLRNSAVDVRNDTNPSYMHDKIMIVDGKVVLTGSFNWSNNAENENNENLLIITSTSLATTYENEFQKIWNTPSS
jgi:phosphatidylserine/phosphatidylglycerophosphate/cardiolipin synthase-like enzyme